MVFSTPVFLFVFLPVVLAAIAAAAGIGRTVRRGRGVRLANLALLAASLLFYAWGEGRLVALMLASIAANWLAGLAVERWRGGAGARVAVALAIAFDLALLGFYKYADFLVANANALLGLEGARAIEPPGVALPIGISFFTFQAMSYVVDLYRRDAPVQRDPLTFATYIAMFPQLVAGPIVRYRDVAHQLVERRVDLEGLAVGARRFLIGLAKKVLVANVAARAADGIFGAPADERTAALCWLGALAYTAQIYFDFSGYSDMAIGLGRMLGFRFLENFRWPYVARSLTDFWRRWHVSLSTWFRDYLYVPLGGNRRSRARTLANLLVVFFLCGLWHGASWSFVVWGLWHGAFLVVERAGLGRALERLPVALRHLYVLLAVVLGWVVFRAETLGGALEFLATMLGLGEGSAALHPVSRHLSGELAVALAAAAVGSTPWLPWLRERLEARPTAGAFALRVAGVALLFAAGLLSAASLAGESYNPFIYFRF